MLHEIITMNLILISDFDGTIVTIDTVVYLLNKFVKEDWKIFDLKYERRKITIDECIRSQVSLLRTVPKNVMLEELENVVSFRKNFKNLATHCNEKNIPFMVASAGLDFVIKHFLNLAELTNISIHAPKTVISDNNMEISFPLKDEMSIDFKEDLVKSFKKQRYKTIYVGDGVSDFNAIQIADFPFVIKDSKLAKICENKRVPHKEIVDFKNVIDTIKSFNQ